MAEREETLLLVDDEENVLSSLRRVFRQDGYHIATASSGKEGLEFLENSPAWMVVSDNAMPEMNGIRFLQEVRDRWPDTVRVMLTGYADLNSAMEAINRGEVYRFLVKPWDPDELRLLVRQGLEQYRLVQDNRRMQALIEEQNALLKGWNETLQRTIDERTEELRQKNDKLEELCGQLKGNFVSTIKIFAGLIELRNPAIGGHARRVSALSKSLAYQMEMSEDQVNNVEVAALLHDIGKIGLPDEVLAREERFMVTGQRALVRQHPVLGQAALQIVDNLDSIGILVRHHHERWDGGGYPDGAKGEAIPLGSRIIAIANTFDHYWEAGSKTATHFIESHIGPARDGAFDPAVMLAFKKLTDSRSATSQVVEVVLGIGQLQEGMVLAQDLRTTTGILLIPKGEMLRQPYLDKLFIFQREKLIPATACVYKGQG